MQGAVAKETDTVREKRARLIKAEAEQEASSTLVQAAREMSTHPIAFELRRMQTVSEVEAEHNCRTIFTIPSDILLLARDLTNRVKSSNSLPQDRPQQRRKRCSCPCTSWHRGKLCQEDSGPDWGKDHSGLSHWTDQRPACLTACMKAMSGHGLRVIRSRACDPARRTANSMSFDRL